MGDHPFNPQDIDLPDYVPNTKTVMEILVFFFGINGLVIVSVWIYSGTKSHLKGCLITRVKIGWFLLCAFTHSIVEAYFALYHKSFLKNHGFLDQLWKEYAKADGRYVTGDVSTICIEAITGFIVGPLAIVSAYAFLTNSPARHLYQMILSVCQLYGTVLYFTTEYKDDWIHCKLYDPLYFWFYYVFMNGLWMVIPSLCILESFNALNKTATLAKTQEQYVVTNTGSKVKKAKAK